MKDGIKFVFLHDPELQIHLRSSEQHTYTLRMQFLHFPVEKEVHNSPFHLSGVLALLLFSFPVYLVYYVGVLCSPQHVRWY